jgi:hypothetical protein
MAIETLWYVMDGKLGVDLNNVLTSVTQGVSPAQPEYPGPPANLGDRVQGNNGSEWMYVIASATISAYNYIAINRNFGAQNMSTVLAASGVYVPGFAQFRLPTGVTVGNANGGVANAGDFFWALIKANQGARVNLNTSISCAPGVALYVQGSTPGWLTTSVTTSTNIVQVIGVRPVVSVTGADNGAPGAMEVAMFNYPFPGILVSVNPTSV